MFFEEYKMHKKIHYHSDCPYFGGADNMLATLFSSGELRKRYDITFSYRFSELYAEGLAKRVKLDFPVYPVRIPDIYDFSLLSTTIPFFIRRVIFFTQRALCILPLMAYEMLVFYRMMKIIKPDIVHINNGGYPGAFSARAAAIGAKLAGVPLVMMVVNNMAVGYDIFFRWLDYPIDRAVVASVNIFVTGSKAASKRLTEVLGVAANRLLSINHGMSYCAPTIAADEIRRLIGLEKFEGVIFGIAGVLGPRKGHYILLNAVLKLAELQKEGMPLFKIVIMGNGPLRNDLEDFIESRDLSEYCIFVDEKEYKDYINYLMVFDVLVLSSTEYEDFPFVILEAMSHGKPVIASKVGGTTEQVIHGETGLLVDPGEIDQLVSAMLKLLSSDKLRKQMGSAGREYFVNHFISEIAVDKYLLLYS